MMTNGDNVNDRNKRVTSEKTAFVSRRCPCISGDIVPSYSKVESSDEVGGIGLEIECTDDVSDPGLCVDVAHVSDDESGIDSAGVIHSSDCV